MSVKSHHRNGIRTPKKITIEINIYKHDKGLWLWLIGQDFFGTRRKLFCHQKCTTSNWRIRKKLKSIIFTCAKGVENDVHLLPRRQWHYLVPRTIWSIASNSRHINMNPASSRIIAQRNWNSNAQAYLSPCHKVGTFHVDRTSATANEHYPGIRNSLHSAETSHYCCESKKMLQVATNHLGKYRQYMEHITVYSHLGWWNSQSMIYGTITKMFQSTNQITDITVYPHVWFMHHFWSVWWHRSVPWLIRRRLWGTRRRRRFMHAVTLQVLLPWRKHRPGTSKNRLWKTRNCEFSYPTIHNNNIFKKIIDDDFSLSQYVELSLLYHFLLLYDFSLCGRNVYSWICCDLRYCNRMLM